MVLKIGSSGKLSFIEYVFWTRHLICKCFVVSRDDIVSAGNEWKTGTESNGLKSDTAQRSTSCVWTDQKFQTLVTCQCWLLMVVGQHYCICRNSFKMISLMSIWQNARRSFGCWLIGPTWHVDWRSIDLICQHHCGCPTRLISVWRFKSRQNSPSWLNQKFKWLRQPRTRVWKLYHQEPSALNYQISKFRRKHCRRLMSRRAGIMK